MTPTIQTEAEFAALAADEDRELNGDRTFFRDHIDRSFRIRRGFYAEAQRVRFLDRGTGTFAGRSVFVAVHQVKPGLRVRSFFTGPFLMKTLSLSEGEARGIFLSVANAEIVAKIHLLAARPRGIA